jgi:hypothetical protein
MKRQVATPPAVPLPSPAPADTSGEQPASAAPQSEAPPQRRPVRQPGPATAPVAPASAPVPPPASPSAPVPSPASPSTPAPKLGEILTSEQQRQLNASLDQSLSRTQTTLIRIARKPLTKEQQGIVDQVQNFMQQAQSTRSSDLVAARRLADRAEVLARDLAARLR